MNLPNPNLAIGAVGLVALAVIVHQVFANRTTITAAAQALNPVNPDNVVASTVNRAVAIVTDEQGATLGGKLWEWFNPTAAAAERAITAPVRITPRALTSSGIVSYWELP